MIAGQAERARRTLGGPAVYAALAVIALFVLVALLAPVIAPHDPFAQPDAATQANLAPSGAHLLGTDRYSRDVLSRLVFGARVSLGIAALAVGIAMTLGTAVGALAGYAGGWTDRLVTRTVDAILSVPRVLVLIFIVAAFPHLSVFGLAIMLGLTGWPAMAKVVRAQVRETAAMDYVLAARALGVRPLGILTRHVLPAAVPQILVAATLAVATVIPLEAGLSFLGLGVRQPTPSWGNMMLDGADFGAHTWWLLVFPGMAIVITVLSINVIGERLREMVDPRVRASR
ncbi:MAG TPA: ABC transporter permease [Gemmatimonadaceae bacterium]|nr:ABC transporter permease [Gemmatimonadaceae bacterium]